MGQFKMYLEAYCRQCGSNQRKHQAKGLCVSCYRHKRYEEVEKPKRKSYSQVSP